ncbi:metallophosphoesterase [Antarcticirhabdus aurantiaca]|uniref:Metallophosphoesterase n=1 Tax=Antarcticirhabdus aurantiaca TaxID=2606717 RepID=A0ACD4NHG8_9HYPH|nr:metallophosphoesterase [Antarcticirhabdus aurantiaca]WAJ26240.1 metallophosphoesterase [Jeongeuplla avenae]
MDEMVFAIGDVHGESRLLAQTLAWVERTAVEYESRPILYILGDLVDRGPDTRGALDLAVETLARWPGSKLLLGNHDRWFLDFVDGAMRDADRVEHWFGQGGAEALQSYGFDLDDPRRAAEEIALRHPSHRRLLAQASLYERRNGHLFVHAGIEPGRSLADQGEDQFLWIRRPFLDHVGPLGHVVVHGHTPQKPARPTVTENRISLDTGAATTGVLTAAAWPPPFGTCPPIFAATAKGSGKVRPIEPRRLDRGLGTVLDR